ncbi:hypothetical protein GCM10027080_24820 [Pedococcus soli]
MQVPLRGDVVSFPHAIPSQSWIVERLLWADRLGALWPGGTPQPHGRREFRQAQEETLQSIERLCSEDLFVEYHVDHCASEQIVADLADLDVIPHEQVDRFLKETGIGDAQPPSETAPAPRRSANSRDLFMYVNKLPPNVTDGLKRLGVVKPNREGLLEVRTAQDADALMSVAMNHAVPVFGPDEREPMIADASTDSAFWQAAMGRDDDHTVHPGVAVTFPLAVPLGNVTIEQVLNFRLKHDADRIAYLGQLAEYADRQVTSSITGTQMTKRLRDRVAGDMALASQGMVRRLRQYGVALALQTTSAAIAVAKDPHDPLGIAQAATSLAAATLPVATVSLRRPHQYLRSAGKAGLLAHPDALLNR